MDDMAQRSNSDIASHLGMSHSSVSRMRTGERIASVDTLDKIVNEFGADPGSLLAAAAAAASGDKTAWVELLASLFDDGEPAVDLVSA